MKLTDDRLFGRTGVKVSPLTLRCMMFGAKPELDASIRIIDRAIDAGVNILDTANVYSRGRSEEFTGEALKRNDRRQQISLCTKVHGVMDDVDPNQQGNSHRHIIEQCEASLRRLPVSNLSSAGQKLLSTRPCERSMISSVQARCGIPEPPLSPGGKLSKRSGQAKSLA
jgi:predicted oxidoreductase